MTVCRGGALLRPRPPGCCRAMGGAEPRPYKWRAVLQNKTPPKGVVIETAGSSARSAAAAADTHAALPTVHRTVGIAASRRPGFSRLVALQFQNKNTTQRGGHRNGGLLGSLGGCRRRHAHGLGNHPPDGCHPGYRRDRPILASPPRKKNAGHPKGQSSKRRAPRLARRLSPPTRTRPWQHATGMLPSRLSPGPACSRLVALYFQKQKTPRRVSFVFGAGDEARTRYLDLGKVALYQMSYARGTELIIAYHAAVVNPEFTILR